MIKRRGYYTIEVGGKEITGHFSVNFWALLEEELGLDSLGETFAFMGKGIGMSKIRSIIFCSTKAYALEEEKVPAFANPFQCGIALEDFNEDHLVTVMEAFAESKLLGSEANFGIERGVAEDTDADGKK